MTATRIAVAIAVVGIGCRSTKEAPSTPRISEASAAPSVVAPVVSAASAPRPSPEVDPILAALATGRWRSLSVAASRRAGALDAVIDGPAGPISAEVRIARIEAPHAYRSALAFYRLAQALGLDLVPKTELRALGAGDLVSLASDARRLAEHAAVQNDGTMDALVVVKPPPDVRAIDEAGFEPRVWAKWAASPAVAADEDRKLVASYIGMRILDYIAGNALRLRVFCDDRTRTLVLTDNDGAFPLHLEAGALDQLLREVRAFQRFPRGLATALSRFNRDRAISVFSPGSFETWLLPPRTLIELEERRAGVETLIAARIAERGDAALFDP